LDRIKDARIIGLIEQIGAHYRSNISNRFLRPILLQLNIDKTTWDHIETLTEKMEMYLYQGFHLDELYRQIAACARFVEVARNNMLPTLRNKMSAMPSTNDKILRDMAASNFKANLQLFADQLNQLYVFLVEIDRAQAVKRPAVYTQIQELYNVGRLLVGH